MTRASRSIGEHRAGCSKRPSSKAAASEEARRTLRYVEPLSAARTKLADFFSILLTERETVMEREQGGDRDGGGGGRFFQRRRPCRFCIDKGSIDFKDVGLLRNFLTERGRIVPRRISGNCMRHQRELTAAVKRARHIALISFAEER